MTPDELDAVLADRPDLNPFEEALIASLREAWAEVEWLREHLRSVSEQRLALAIMSPALDAERRVKKAEARAERDATLVENLRIELSGRVAEVDALRTRNSDLEDAIARVRAMCATAENTHDLPLHPASVLAALDETTTT